MKPSASPTRLRLVDYLLLVLEAHAQTLKRLAAFFGEEELLQLLESAGEREEASAELDLEPGLLACWAPPAAPGSASSAYQEIEGAVHELGLPAVLEFHLWAYPLYRAFIESSVDLGATLSGTGDEAGQRLVDLAVKCSESWVKGLVVHPQLFPRVERIAQIPWLRFRSEALRKLGHRPLGPAV